VIRRTTIELDEELVARAKLALGLSTTRATVEEALRRAAEAAETDSRERRAAQIEVLQNLAKHLDLEVLASDEMWR